MPDRAAFRVYRFADDFAEVISGFGVVSAFPDVRIRSRTHGEIPPEHDYAAKNRGNDDVLEQAKEKLCDQNEQAEQQDSADHEIDSFHSRVDGSR